MREQSIAVKPQEVLGGSQGVKQAGRQATQGGELKQYPGPWVFDLRGGVGKRGGGTSGVSRGVGHGTSEGSL